MEWATPFVWAVLRIFIHLRAQNTRSIRHNQIAQFANLARVLLRDDQRSYSCDFFRQIREFTFKCSVMLMDFFGLI